MQPKAQRTIESGVLAAILAAPTAYLTYGMCSTLYQGQFDLIQLLVLGIIVYFYGIVISAPIALTLGLPLVLWLRKSNRLTWLAVCVSAAVIGTLALSAIWVAGYQTYRPLSSFAGLGAVSGLVSGIAFCAVVRPNNSFKPTPLRGAA